jgi:hypothetical protein
MAAAFGIPLAMSRDCALRSDKAKAELGYTGKLSIEEGLTPLQSEAKTRVL